MIQRKMRIAVEKKYELIKVNAILYRYISLTAANCSNTVTVIYLFHV